MPFGDREQSYQYLQAALEREIDASTLSPHVTLALITSGLFADF